MKKQIREVQDYFVNKMFENHMCITEIGEHTLNVTIDEEYTFKLWICMGAEGVKTWNGVGGNFMELPINKTQSKKLWKVLNPIIKKHHDTVLKRQKMKEYNRIKKEYNL